MCEKFLNDPDTKQYNAYVSARKQQSDILDKIVERGIKFGVVKPEDRGTSLGKLGELEELEEAVVTELTEFRAILRTEKVRKVRRQTMRAHGRTVPTPQQIPAHLKRWRRAALDEDGFPVRMSGEVTDDEADIEELEAFKRKKR